MDADQPTPDWEATIRPWHLAAAAIAVTQLVAIVAAFALVSSNPTAAFTACGILLVLEFAKWVVDRIGLGRLPHIDLDALYASAPLMPAHRTLVAFNLAGQPLLVVMLSLMISTTAGLVGLVVASTAVPPLVRVWRANSWLAISRLPSRPRRKAVSS